MRSLVIGRFQPFHIGHLRMIECAASESDHVVVGIGSSNRSGTAENPFTAEEREEMVRRSLATAVGYSFERIPDFGDAGKWIGWIRENISFDVFMTNSETEERIFSRAGFRVKPLPFYKRDIYSATAVRKAIVSGGDYTRLLPQGTLGVLESIGGIQRIALLENRKG